VVLHVAVFCFACSSLLEEHTASMFRVTELLQVDTELMGWKTMCQLHRNVSENLNNDRGIHNSHWLKARHIPYFLFHSCDWLSSLKPSVIKDTLFFPSHHFYIHLNQPSEAEEEGMSKHKRQPSFEYSFIYIVFHQPKDSY
jgi:hypothetical protein